MVRTSVPASRRWTAKAWRKEWGVMGFANATSSMRGQTGAVDRMSREGLVRVLPRKEPMPGSTQSPPLPQDLEQSPGEHHVPRVLPLPLLHAEGHPLAIDRGHGEVNGFSDAEPSDVTGCQDRAMLGKRDAVENVNDFRGTEHPRHALRLFRRGDYGLDRLRFLERV